MLEVFDCGFLFRRSDVLQKGGHCFVSGEFHHVFDGDSSEDGIGGARSPGRMAAYEVAFSPVFYNYLSLAVFCNWHYLGNSCIFAHFFMSRLKN